MVIILSVAAGVGIFMMLAIAMGACVAAGGDILTDAFGVVAIMASAETRNAIMETVNIKHGLKTEAGAMICSVGIITWFVWDKISVIKNFSRLFLHFVYLFYFLDCMYQKAICKYYRKRY